MISRAWARFWDVEWVPVPSNRIIRVLFAVATLAALGFVAFLFWQIMSLSGDLKTVQKGQTKSDVQTFNLAQQWELACQEKKVNPSLKPLCDYSKQIRQGTQKGLGALPQLVGRQGLPGKDGAPGKDGKDGRPGPKPTFAELLAAAKTVCSTTNLCASSGGGIVGPEGPEGPEGPAGPAGKTGPAGAPGKNGISVTDVDCSLIGPSFHLRITFTFTLSNGSHLTTSCSVR
jgi:hypothetical protein